MFRVRFIASLQKLSIVTALILVMAGTTVASEAGSYAEALAQAQAQNKMLLIDFYTDW